MPNLLNTITSTGNNSLINDKSPETICEFVAQGKSVDYHNEGSNYDFPKCNSEIRSEVYMSTLVVGVLYLLTYSSYGALVSKFGNKTVAGI